MRSRDWYELAELDDATLTRSETLARPQDVHTPDTYVPSLSLPRLAEPWRNHAACDGMGPDVFFPEPTPALDRGGVFVDYSAAQAVCDGCPVRQECLEEALKYHEVHGLWGGLTPRQRKTEVTRRGGTRVRECHVCLVEFTAAGTAYYCTESCRATARRRRNLESKRRTA